MISNKIRKVPIQEIKLNHTCKLIIISQTDAISRNTHKTRLSNNKTEYETLAYSIQRAHPADSARYIKRKTITLLYDTPDVKHFVHEAESHTTTEHKKDSTFGVNDGNKAESIQN